MFFFFLVWEISLPGLDSGFRGLAGGLESGFLTCGRTFVGMKRLPLLGAKFAFYDGLNHCREPRPRFLTQSHWAWPPCHQLHHVS